MENFRAEETEIKGLHKIQYKFIEEPRGSVMEFYRQSDFEAAGLPTLGERPQINAPMSIKGAVRGIHAEFAHKLVAVASGEVFAAIVDLRKESPTAGKWLGFDLKRGQGLFVSSGLGNSFQSTSEEPSVYLYHFEKEWTPSMAGLACNPLDPTLNIPWPIARDNGMIISDKDLANPSLEEALNG